MRLQRIQYIPNWFEVAGLYGLCRTITCFNKNRQDNGSSLFVLKLHLMAHPHRLDDVDLTASRINKCDAIFTRGHRHLQTGNVRL